jgi:hypothetical protein
MVGIVVGPGHQVQIVGHGLTVTSDFKLADGVTISAGTPMRQTSFGTTVGQLSEDAALIVMERLADFSLVVCEPRCPIRPSSVSRLRLPTSQRPFSR